ncbi:Plasmodium vivax Vir protein, putative [Plasmodium vivax]|nr:Plasmodium vivax Vir protein, putative [Plasmodium vivax]
MDKRTKTNVSEGCKYLNYRINEELLKHKNDQTLEEIYTKLNDAYKDQKYNLNTICMGIMKPINKDIFEDVKRVFDIYNKFNKILRGHSKSNIPNCNYIDEAIDLYMKYESTCTEQSNTKFCKALEDFRLYYQSSIGNINTHCTAKKLILDSFQKKTSDVNEMGEEDSLDEALEDETESSPNYNAKKNMLTSFYIILPITFFSFIVYKVNKYFIYIYEYSLILHDTIL